MDKKKIENHIEWLWGVLIVVAIVLAILLVAIIESNKIDFDEFIYCGKYVRTEGENGWGTTSINIEDKPDCLGRFYNVDVSCEYAIFDNLGNVYCKEEKPEEEILTFEYRIETSKEAMRKVHKLNNIKDTDLTGG